MKNLRKIATFPITVMEAEKWESIVLYYGVSFEKRDSDGFCVYGNVGSYFESNVLKV